MALLQAIYSEAFWFVFHIYISFVLRICFEHAPKGFGTIPRYNSF